MGVDLGGVGVQPSHVASGMRQALDEASRKRIAEHVDLEMD